MSIIAALDAGECLFMAADSMVTEEGGIRRTEPKLNILPGRPVAWGFSGTEGVGFQFNDWFKAWIWPSDATWRSVADAAIDELSRLNGRKRHLAKLAGVEVKPDDLAGVLMAGYVGGVADIYELTDRGEAASVKHVVMAAIGSGGAHATIAYHTLRNASPNPLTPNQQLLAFVVEIAAKMAPMCGMPIQVLRITSENAEAVMPTQKPAP